MDGNNFFNFLKVSFRFLFTYYLKRNVYEELNYLWKVWWEEKTEYLLFKIYLKLSVVLRQNVREEAAAKPQTNEIHRHDTIYTLYV